MARSTVVRYCFGNDFSVELKPCTSLTKPNLILSDRYDGETYTLELVFIVDKFPLLLTVSGKPDEAFTPKDTICLHVNGSNIELPSHECVKHLMELLGDRPIKDINIYDIMSDQMTAMELFNNTVESFSKVIRALPIDE